MVIYRAVSGAEAVSCHLRISAGVGEAGRDVESKAPAPWEAGAWAVPGVVAPAIAVLQGQWYSGAGAS